MKKIISSILIISLLCFGFFNVSADTKQPDSHNLTTKKNSGSTDYRSYLAETDTLPIGPEITLSAENAENLQGGAQSSSYGNKKTVLFSEDESSADFAFTANNDVNYFIELNFVPLDDGNFSNSSVGLKINGKYPFDEAKELSVSRRWKMEKFKKGNEILSSMNFVKEETSVTLNDPSGRQSKPLLFRFSKGVNTLTVIANTGNFSLLNIRLYPINEVKSYEELKKSYNTISEDVADISETVLEAEDFCEVSSTTLTPDYDKSDVNTSPNSPVLLLYNYISANKYRSPGQWIKWEFEPKETGYYKISMRVRQNAKSGFSVARRLYINGEVPFEECNEIRFDYKSDWYIKDLGDAEPYSFFFEKGKKYALTLEVTAGSLSQITGKIDDLIYSLNSLYRSVIMVVGNDPDTYRDYRLGKVIPDFEKTVGGLYGELSEIVKEIEKLNSGRSGSSLSSFHSLMNRLKKIKANPDFLSKNISAFKSEIQTLSSWNQDAKEQPLDLDYISVYPANGKLKGQKSHFIKQLIFDLKRILASFTKDYGTVGDVYDENSSLRVWMNSGRDQMNIVKRLVDNSFKVNYNTNVNISLVTVDIRTAVLAGTAPDVSLFISGDMPVNLALRGAVQNLSEHKNFGEVSKRFEEHSLKPFMWNGGCYALPISETFNMLFVRTDIFDELGLSVPNTWDEFYQVSTILQRNNLEVGIPASIGMFATLLFQNGGSFYNEEINQTEFGSEAATKAFSTWTGLFARYGFPLAFDFYNRFTSGEMPLAIADYTQYLKIEAASPELSGRWKMHLIPGVINEDGSVNRSLSISAATGSDTSPGLAQSVTSAVIFSGSKHKKQAWEFIDWFTSDETQRNYGREIEDTLGSISRYTSANLNAFKSLPWSRAQRNILEEQRKSVVALNEVSGNYSVTRELVNAFRKVVYDNANPTDTIYSYNKRINKELMRKTKNS